MKNEEGATGCWRNHNNRELKRKQEVDLGRSVNKGYSTRMNPQANGRGGGTTGTRKNGQRASGPSSSDGLGGRSGGLRVHCLVEKGHDSPSLTS